MKVCVDNLALPLLCHLLVTSSITSEAEPSDDGAELVGAFFKWLLQYSYQSALVTYLGNRETHFVG